MAKEKKPNSWRGYKSIPADTVINLRRRISGLVDVLQRTETTMKLIGAKSVTLNTRETGMKGLLWVSRMVNEIYSEIENAANTAIVQNPNVDIQAINDALYPQNPELDK